MRAAEPELVLNPPGADGDGSGDSGVTGGVAPVEDEALVEQALPEQDADEEPAEGGFPRRKRTTSIRSSSALVRLWRSREGGRQGLPEAGGPCRCSWGRIGSSQVLRPAGAGLSPEWRSRCAWPHGENRHRRLSSRFPRSRRGDVRRAEGAFRWMGPDDAGWGRVQGLPDRTRGGSPGRCQEAIPVEPSPATGSPASGLVGETARYGPRRDRRDAS